MEPQRAGPLLTIDDILHARAQRPQVTTRERGWSGVTVDLHRPYFRVAESYPGLDHHLICFCPSGSSQLVQHRDGQTHRTIISAGMSYLMPAGYASSWEGDSGLSARLRVPLPLVAAAAEQIGQRNLPRIEIHNVFQMRDPTIKHLAHLLLAEMELASHPGQRLVVDMVSMALAAHLLRRYNTFDVRALEHLPALRPRELARLVAYIEDNLDRAITLAELAAVVNVSRFHFARMFKRSTAMTPIAFVEQCRLRRAQTLIVETDLPLSEIALMIGFADQSHFTRRFHRHVGCAPAQFARDHGRRRQRRPPDS